jgi:oligopeptide/dipeptide ABC transporter ATP-binding protein
VRGLEKLLQVDGLSVEFTLGGRPQPVVSDVTFSLEKGRTLGLVGESGCGKSVTALSILGLLPDPPGRIAGGRILFHGEDLTRLSQRELSHIRGRRISMVFQEPMTSLNPVFTVGDQVAEVFRTHMGLTKQESLEQAVEMLRRVGIPDPEGRVRNYPHQMSGGMRQRVLIAIAVACHPEVLLADEPTTALDVTIQAQILALMRELRDEMGTALLLITHDFGVVAEAADEVAVMYAGRIVEHAGCETLFRSPWHPYTTGLLRSRPRPGGSGGRRQERLEAIPGTVPSPSELPPGCPFEPRCSRSREVCSREAPPLEEKSPGQLARCWIPPAEEG